MSPHGPKPKPVEERFWDKVTIKGRDECWNWTGAVTGGMGYGYLKGGIGRPRWVAAHRLSWELEHGPIPDGLCVLHRCDRPVCVNPRHLWLGTRVDNNRDMIEKGRGRDQRGEVNTNAKLTEEGARSIIKALSALPRRSQAMIAKEHGVSQPQVSRIMRRESWPHLWDE